MQKITLKKGKKLYAMLALIAIVSTTIPTIARADPAETILAVEPYATMKSPGQTFTINITVTNVVDLAGFEFNMTYDPNILNVTHIDMGPFFPYYFVWKNQTWWYDHLREASAAWKNMVSGNLTSRNPSWRRKERKWNLGYNNVLC